MSKDVLLTEGDNHKEGWNARKKWKAKKSNTYGSKFIWILTIQNIVVWDLKIYKRVKHMTTAAFESGEDRGIRGS